MVLSREKMGMLRVLRVLAAWLCIPVHASACEGDRLEGFASHAGGALFWRWRMEGTCSAEHGAHERHCLQDDDLHWNKRCKAGQVLACCATP
jgi:hypothetical protein